MFPVPRISTNSLLKDIVVPNKSNRIRIYNENLTSRKTNNNKNKLIRPHIVIDGRIGLFNPNKSVIEKKNSNHVYNDMYNTTELESQRTKLSLDFRKDNSNNYFSHDKMKFEINADPSVYSLQKSLAEGSKSPKYEVLKFIFFWNRSKYIRLLSF